MHQVTLPTTSAVGCISRHNISDAEGRKIVAKGRVLTAADVAQIVALGIETITVVRLADDDIDEHAAAALVAQQCAGQHTRARAPHHGRADIESTIDGVLIVALDGLAQWHRIDGVTIATRRTYAVVRPGQRIATIKVIPFAIPAAQLAVSIAPILTVAPFVRTRVGVVIIGAPATHERLIRTHLAALQVRLTSVQAHVVAVQRVVAHHEAVCSAFDALRAAVDMIVTIGETSIMDRDDVMPQALVAAGGHITCYGAPVEPGNLLLLGVLDSIPVMGAPGCIRGAATNVVDLLLPRLVAGLDVHAADVYALAHGGLLEEES